MTVNCQSFKWNFFTDDRDEGTHGSRSAFANCVTQRNFIAAKIIHLPSNLQHRERSVIMTTIITSMKFSTVAGRVYTEETYWTNHV